MKVQILRFSPHQNAKTLSVMMAVLVTLFAIPAGLIFTLFPPVVAPGAPRPPPGFLFFLFPVFYLIFGYVATLIYCAFYNLVARFTGGIEFGYRGDGLL